jgi:aspartokinase-like uncharacterized kinase
MHSSPQRPVVVKVGGSLFDLPDLGARLESFLSGLNMADVILVPGGGPTADLVRSWDRNLHLGEEKAHWLALRALGFNAYFLATLLPETRVIERLEECHLPHPRGSRPVVDMHAWAIADESLPDHLPHRWEVTSDSLAARLAMCCAATELVLLKSVDFSGEDWRQAADAGIVDGHFPHVMTRPGSDLRCRLVNLRALEPARGRP